jgi:hypothetical protein
MSNLLLVVNAALAFTLVGLILTVQYVHYPAFGDVGPMEWSRFHALHEQRITWVVGPLMLAEAIAAALLVVWRPEGLPPWAAWTAGGLVAVAWLDTAMWAVPLHGRLSEAFDPALLTQLLRANAVRTAAWVARAGLLGWLVVRLGR